MNSTPLATTSPAPLAPATMRAVLQHAYGSADVLRPGTIARPEPGPGEVLVRVHAAGIDRGTWHMMTGRPYLMRVIGFGFARPKNPIAGLDLAGTVVALGPGTTRLRVGDAVFGIGAGSFAQYARAREDKLAHLPRGVTFEQAAVLGVSGLTALQALRDAGRVRAGERVLVLGASGGVGTYAVQLAKALGAEVSAVCSAGKADLVRSLGADRVFDYRAEDFAEGSTRHDVILDIAGNTPLSRLRRALTPRGRLVFVGNEHGGDFTAGFGRPLRAFALAPFVAQRFAMLTNREHFEDLEVLRGFVEAGQVRPAIDRVCSLDEVPAALRALEAGEVRGKIVVRVA